jgi:flagellar biosynthetic protein FliR/FlhB
MPIKVLVGLMAIATILPALTRIYVKAFDNMAVDILKYLNTFPFIMLMASDDKTEEPSSKKLSDARKKGQVPKSNDLNSGLILLFITIVFSVYGDKLFTNGRIFINQCFALLSIQNLDIASVRNIFVFMIKNGLIAAAPIILTVMTVGVISNIAQTGFLVSSGGLKPKLDKLNPIQGFKRFFSKRTVMEFLKTLMKITLISYVAYSFVKGKIFEILKTSDLNPNGIYPFVKSITDSQLIRMVIVILLIGITDYIFQKRQFKKEMRMTKQEVKEEYKQMEGDPQIKSKIRQKQREMATRRMMHEVPKATVVVTNPTHFAVALKYEKGEDSAPIIIAKGADLIALKIKEIAKENNVPIVENKHLARNLYARADINEPVPVELYQAVAEIIAYVYSLKKV